MITALERGALAYADDEKGRASRLPPESPATSPTPRPHNTSSHPKPANDTDSVRQNDPLAQREQPLFRRRSRVQVAIATVRLDQFGNLIWDIFKGPCLTSRASDVVEQFVPLVAIACGQDGFRWMMEKVVARYAPHVGNDQLEEIIERTLVDAPSYKSAAIGRRWGVTIEQFDRLGLSHIWPAGWGKRKLDNHKRKRRNKAVKVQRHATQVSKTPRELSIAQLKPWALPDAPCRSRARFYALPEAERNALVDQARKAAMGRWDRFVQPTLLSEHAKVSQP